MSYTQNSNNIYITSCKLSHIMNTWFNIPLHELIIIRFDRYYIHITTKGDYRFLSTFLILLGCFNFLYSSSVNAVEISNLTILMHILDLTLYNSPKTIIDVSLAPRGFFLFDYSIGWLFRYITTFPIILSLFFFFSFVPLIHLHFF